MWKVAIGVAVVIAAVLAWLLSHEPPRQLDLIDSVWPGDAATAKIASDVAYGNDPRQKYDVYAPTGHVVGKDAPLPLLVFFHGGGWYKGNRESYGFAGRAFAAKGFVVAVPSYRLVPRNVFPDFLADGAAAVAKARSQAASYGADPERIVLSGHSAGAHIAAMIALDPEYLTTLGVPMASVRGVAGLSGPYNFLPLDKESAINAMGKVRPAERTQPIHYVSAASPPMLLITGSADTTVKPHNAFDLARALQAAGVDGEVKAYQGLTHEDVVMALSRPFRGKAPVLTDAAAFLHRVADAPRRARASDTAPAPAPPPLTRVPQAP